MTASTVLLISRGTMSGGRAIGECLARHEGIRYLTREDLLASVNRHGDIASRVTSRIARAVEAYDEFSRLRRPYRILMKRALLEYTMQGPLAYFGSSGHMLLDRIPHFVRIRLLAPFAVRIAGTRKRLGYSEEDAREYVRREDAERLHWAQLMYGRDIRAPELYDFCLNLERIPAEGTCLMLRHIMQLPDFQPTPESVSMLEDDLAATRALATLVLDPRTLELEMSATVKSGRLRLVGPYLPENELATVRSVAASAPGVQQVDYEPGYAPAFEYA
jgi:cytidylate kinase